MKPKVYFNQKCTICKIEINHYKKICDTIEWLDINSNQDIYKETLKSKNQILRRIHVKNNDIIYVGIDGFIFIWSRIPRYKFLSKLLKLPIIYQFAFVCYEILAFVLFLKNFKQFKK